MRKSNIRKKIVLAVKQRAKKVANKLKKLEKKRQNNERK